MLFLSQGITSRKDQLKDEPRAILLGRLHSIFNSHDGNEFSSAHNIYHTEFITEDIQQI